MTIKFGKLIHVGVIVNNIEKAVKLNSELFNKKIGENTVDHRGKKEIEGKIGEVDSKTIGKLKYSILSMGDKTFEFLQPVNCLWLEKALKEKGEGIHHVSYGVQNLEDTLNQLFKKGLKLDEFAPKSDEIAFVKTTDGMLIELIDIEKEKKRTGIKMSYH